MLTMSKKLWIASIVSHVIVSIRRLFSLPNTTIVTRQGIHWSLDLTEGIDLSIYITGHFKVYLINKYKEAIKKGHVILEIGANIGGETLQLAQLVGEQGHVIALEPTSYAFKKLKTNINLNPKLLPLITAEQIFIGLNDQIPPLVYASWPLVNANKLHKEHKGKLESTQGAISIPLDQYIQTSGLSRLNGIKLDVDGNEHDVLMSGRDTLQQFKPYLMMELAPHAFAACPQKFAAMLQLLWDLNYEMIDVANDKVLPKDLQQILDYIVPKIDIDILAIPK